VQGSLLPLREQVHQALSLLTVPASPRLIATVHEAFFASTFPNARLTSLRRDEERSFRTAPFARPYYICAALTAVARCPRATTPGRSPRSRPTRAAPGARS